MIKTLLLTILLIMYSHIGFPSESYDKSNLLSCSAYHFRAKLNSQYLGKEKYDYHDKYFNNLQEIFLNRYPEVPTSSFILSVTSIMESWSYEAQEKGRSYANSQIERNYKKLCNSIIEIN